MNHQFTIVLLAGASIFGRPVQGNAQSTIRIAAMQHIKIVAKTAKPQESLTALLKQLQNGYTVLNARIQGAINNINTGGPCAPAGAQIVTIQSIQQAEQQLQSLLNSMSEMSTEDQLNLQQAMQQKSQFEDALSNVLKSFSNTQQAIVNNIK